MREGGIVKLRVKEVFLMKLREKNANICVHIFSEDTTLTCIAMQLNVRFQHVYTRTYSSDMCTICDCSMRHRECKNRVASLESVAHVHRFLPPSRPHFDGRAAVRAVLKSLTIQ